MKKNNELKQKMFDSNGRSVESQLFFFLNPLILCVDVEKNDNKQVEHGQQISNTYMNYRKHIHLLFVLYFS